MSDEQNDQVLSPGQFGRALKDFIDMSMQLAEPEVPEVVRRLRDHLGTEELSELPIISRALERRDLPNVQVALDRLAEREGWSFDVVGLHSQHGAMMGYSLAQLAAPPLRGAMYFAIEVSPGSVERMRIRLDAETEIECVVNALQLIRHGERGIAVMVSQREQMMGRAGIGLEVMAADREEADSLVAEIARLMAEHNVYRGRVLSFSRNEQGGAEVETRVLPEIERGAIVLPDGVLERIERHALAPVRHRERLLAAGRHLKRGLLLHGPPGTGKTLTAMYLVSQMPGRTVVILSGQSFGLIEPACSIARELQPSMVILEDVDLVAHERTYMGAEGPILFELLNQMDGLAEDADIVFMLTTNRPDILEPALAARPGRIDEAVELPLPDAEGRRALLELYGRGLTVRAERLDNVVERLEGASPAHVKELLRKAALIAAEESGGEIVVEDGHLEQALDALVISSGQVRSSLFAGPPGTSAYPFPEEAVVGEDQV